MEDKKALPRAQVKPRSGTEPQAHDRFHEALKKFEEKLRARGDSKASKKEWAELWKFRERVPLALRYQYEMRIVHWCPAPGALDDDFDKALDDFESTFS
jgi:hypothetical protein